MVSDNYSPTQLNWIGVVPYEIGFEFTETTDVKVIHFSDDSTQTEMVLNTDYTITLSNGIWVMTPLSDWEDGFIIMRRETQKNQTWKVSSSSVISRTVLEKTFDKVIRIIQELYKKISGSLPTFVWSGPFLTVVDYEGESQTSDDLTGPRGRGIVYEPELDYLEGEPTYYNKTWYEAQRDILSSEGILPGTDETTWEEKSSAPGTTYRDNAKYSENDIVWHLGMFYEYINATPSKGNIPAVGAYWKYAEIEHYPITKITSGESITGPVFVYIGSDGKTYNCDNRELLKSIVSGCAINTSVLDGTTFKQENGTVGGFSGLTAGSKYYLGNFGQPVLRSTLLDYEQIVQVGIAKSATELQLQIMPPENTQGSWVNAEIGDIKYSAVYEDKRDKGWISFNYNNAVSQSVYSALFAKVGHSFNAQHVEAGDPDLSGSSTLFYPTPVPGKYGRVGIPDIEFISTDIVDSGGSLRVNGTNLHSTTRYGTPFRFEVISGSAPTGLIDGTTYYGAFGEDYLLLHSSESDAINTTNRIAYIDSGSGTFRLTQEGVAIDDAIIDHVHTYRFDNGVLGDEPLPSYNADSDDTGGGATSGIRTGTGVMEIDPEKVSNETRGTTFYEFAYIKAESVTPSGEPVSALRYSFEITGSTWQAQQFVITHNLNEDMKNLLVKVEIKRDGTFDWQEVDVVLDGALSGTYGISKVDTGSKNSFILQTGTEGLLAMTNSGIRAALANTVGSIRGLVIKPNLIANYAYAPSIREITDAVDVIDTFPSASELIGERVYGRTGSGTGKRTINCAGSEVLVMSDGTEQSSIIFVGNGTISVISSGGKLYLKEDNRTMYVRLEANASATSFDVDEATDTKMPSSSFPSPTIRGNLGLIDLSNTNVRLVAPEDGLYLVNFRIDGSNITSQTSNAKLTFETQLIKNGSDSIVQNNNYLGVIDSGESMEANWDVTATTHLAKDDYIEVNLYWNVTGTAVETTCVAAPFLSSFELSMQKCK